MTTFNLNEFEHYSAVDIYTYIMMQSEKEFRIIMHKETDTNSDRFDIMWEYHLAALIGHKLFEVSETFAYYVPSVHLKQPFFFELSTNDPEKLADALYFIITGLYENNQGITIQFHEQATNHFINAFDDVEMQPACFGLLELAHRYLD
jgi:hypothetical protein